MIHVHAAAKDDTPTSLIKDRHHKIEGALGKFKKSSAKEVRAEIKEILESFVNFDAIGQAAFKKYIKKLSDKERSEYVAAFRELVQATYLKRIRPGLDHKMVFRGDVEIIGDRARVPTTFIRGESEADVDYLLIRGENGIWRAYDLIIDGVSMARNYRREFYKLYKKSGSKGLIEKIRERTRAKRR